MSKSHGPRGERGIAGPPGPTGPKGAAGTAGPSGARVGTAKASGATGMRQNDRLEILTLVEGQIDDINRELDVQMKRLPTCRRRSTTCAPRH